VELKFFIPQSELLKRDA